MLSVTLITTALEISQDESCFIMEYLPISNVYLAINEPAGTFCDVNSSCDDNGHCVNSLCETCAVDVDCVLYSACLQGFYPDADCEEFSAGKQSLETCI